MVLREPFGGPECRTCGPVPSSTHGCPVPILAGGLTCPTTHALTKMRFGAASRRSVTKPSRPPYSTSFFSHRARSALALSRICAYLLSPLASSSLYISSLPAPVRLLRYRSLLADPPLALVAMAHLESTAQEPPVTQDPGRRRFQLPTPRAPVGRFGDRSYSPLLTPLTESPQTC